MSVPHTLEGFEVNDAVERMLGQPMLWWQTVGLFVEHFANWELSWQECIGDYAREQKSVHALRNEPNVIDIRNIGLVGAIELTPRPGEPGKRAYEIFTDCWERGVLIRVTGDIIALSPPLIVQREQIDQTMDTLRAALRKVA